MQLARPRTLTRITTLVAAAALVAACGTDDTTDEVTDPPADEQTAPDEGDVPELDADELEDLLGDQEDLDLPDPNDQVEDGVFRGVGITLPAPDGWQLDPMFLAEGTALALDPEGQQTFAGQAVDTAQLPEGVELDYDLLLEQSREGMGSEPAIDEEVEFNGAERAHLLRFDGLAGQEEGAPDNSLLTVIADDGAGQLAMFNYLAPTDDYDDDAEALLLSQGGFDPDSDPMTPTG